jgi:hypothetical protein
MNPITIPNISISTIGLPTIGIPSVGFPSASGGGGLVWPVGMKEHIKAWYDPKKQGMTNFDVIESYAEDFTASKWVTVQDRAVFTKTASKIHITESMSDGFNTTFIETRQSRYGNEMKINVSGIVAGGVTLKYRYGSYEEVVDITSNGVYTLPAGKAGTNPNGYNGFVMKAKGKCDITITQLPTSILKDFSGNGNHAYLYGGKGKLNSGMGVYQTDFSSWQFYPKLSTVEYSPEQLIIEKVNDPAQFCASSFVGKFIAEVSGIPDGVLLYYRYIDKITGNTVSTTLSNGINEIDCSNANGDVNMTNMFLIGADNKDINITITQIPDYPDQLCYDGKMYAVCYGFPILTDYTVMAERTWFENRNVFLAKGNITTEAKYAFIFEGFKSDGVMAVQSFGAWNDVVSTTDSCISYLTKNKYNGIDIRSGIGADDDMLSIGGALNKGNIELTSVCCHGAIIIADRSFTEEEINRLKQNWDKI